MTTSLKQAFLFICGCSLVFITPAAPALTPAGTIIRNHGVVEYQRDDSTGQVFTSTSNEVIMEVNPVYGINIIPDHSDPVTTSGNEAQLQFAISTNPEVQVIFAYQLIFTGNSTDTATLTPTFNDANSTVLPKLSDGDTGLLVYNDVNGNGAIDGTDILVASWRDANGNGVLTANEVQSSTLGVNYEPDEVADLLVTFFVPDGVNTADAFNDFIFFGIDGASVADAAKTDVGNISKLEVIDDAVMVVSKSASVTEVSPSDTFRYTIKSESTGSSPALKRSYTVDASTYSGVLVYDIIPVIEETGVPLTVVQTASGSDLPPAITIDPATPNGTIIYSSQANPENAPINPTGWTWSETYTVGDTVIAYISSDGTTDNDVANTGSNAVEFTFDVTIPAGTFEQFVSNVAYANYDTGSLGVKNIKSTNEVLVEVVSAANVIIRDTDFEASKPPLTPTGVNDDTQTIALAQAGSFLYFTNRVLNTGTNTDSFNISLDGTTTNLSGWTVSWFRSDGVTPLTDTGIDGIIDTGPIEPAGANLPNPNDFVDIVLRVEIPENAGPTANNPEASFIVLATSVADPSKTDTTTDNITDVSLALMNLDNHILPLGTADPAVITLNGASGSFLEFPLIVENNAPADGEFDSYNMTTPVLPAGWTVVYYLDTDENRVLDDGELLPVLQTREVAPGDAAFLIARIFIPEDALADSDNNGTQDDYLLTFRATSTNNPAVFDEQIDQVRVAFNNRFELTPDRQGVIAAGSATVYAHNLMNYGERSNRFFLTIAEGSPEWTYVLLESDGSAQLPRALDPSDSIEKYYIDLDEFEGGVDSKDFVIQLFATSNTPVGSIDVSTIVAAANDPLAPTSPFPGLPLHSAVDLTRLVAGDLTLTKSANPAAGTKVNPGDTIIYTTDFLNKSSGELTNVIIHDQISPHTTYLIGSGTATINGFLGGDFTFEVSRDGGISYGADAGAGSTVTNVRLRLNKGFPAGEKGSYSFSVDVD